MSFRCQFCNEVQPVYTKPIQVVVAVRQRQYQNHGNVSIGSEIAKEKPACESCSVQHEAQAANFTEPVLSAEPLSNPALPYSL